MGTTSWLERRHWGTGYMLQEDDNAGFTSPTTRIRRGWHFVERHRQGGRHLLLSRAGEQHLGTSGWSNIVSVVVQPLASGPTPGFWQSLAAPWSST